MSFHSPSADRQNKRGFQSQPLAVLLGGPILVSVAASVATFLASILLYRTLDPENAGRLTLALSIMQFSVLFGSLGQPSLLQRIYSQDEEPQHDWLMDSMVSLIMASPILLVVFLLTVQVFRFDRVISSTILLLSWIQIGLLMLTGILNAWRRYAWGSLILRLPNSFLLIPALLLILTGIPRTFESVIEWVFLATLVLAIAVILSLLKSAPRGSLQLDLRARISGLIFLFTQSSYTFPEQAVVLVAGSILDPELLGLYGAIAILIKPFDLLTSVMRSILTTELIRLRSSDQPPLRRTVIILALLGLVLTVLAGPTLIQRVYESRYDGGLNLIPALALAGLFKVVEAFPRSHLIGQASQATLRRFVLFQSILAALLLVIGYGITRNWGGLGLASTLLLITAGRFAISQLVYRATLNP